MEETFLLNFAVSVTFHPFHHHDFQNEAFLILNRSNDSIGLFLLIL